jgi:hypothetical protein
MINFLALDERQNERILLVAEVAGNWYGELMAKTLKVEDSSRFKTQNNHCYSL